jgi:hypothetical protein
MQIHSFPSIVTLTSRRKLRLMTIIVPAFLCAAEIAAQAHGAAGMSLPFALPRLSGNQRDGAILGPRQFEVEVLSVRDPARNSKTRRNGVDCLVLEPQTIWSTPLRNTTQDGLSVSLLLLGSANTIIDVAGAKVGLTLSPADKALQVMFDERSGASNEWRSSGLHVLLETYDGCGFGTLPTLTIQLNRTAKVWHLFVGTRLLADNIPFFAADESLITITAGSEGAWLLGLVQADENPLYLDGNANAVDDVFELKTEGKVALGENNSEKRALLAKQWKAAQRVNHKALHVRRPLPDRN